MFDKFRMFLYLINLEDVDKFKTMGGVINLEGFDKIGNDVRLPTELLLGTLYLKMFPKKLNLD